MNVRTWVAIRVVLLVAMAGLLALVMHFQWLPVARLGSRAAFLSRFSVGITRGDVTKWLGGPTARFTTQADLARSFPDHPVPEREVDPGGSVLCYRLRKHDLRGALALFYVDSTNVVTSALLLEERGT